VIPWTVRVTIRPALADYPPGARFVRQRKLANFELVWLLTGSARWRAAGAERSLVPGQLLLVPPGTEDTFDWDPDVPTRHGYVHFALSGAHPTFPLVRGTRAPSPLDALLEYLVWLATEPSTAWRERAEEVIALLLRLFEAGPLPASGPAPEPPAVVAALAHVRGVWARGMRPVSLAELAGAAAVSAAHLSRQFARAYGLGPVAALERVRLARAATLLSRSSLTVTEVGAACGFADPLHFSRRFRAAYGRSPRGYRSAGGRDEAPAAVRRLAARLELP
jgi:AraC-like DNA-binding protein